MLGATCELLRPVIGQLFPGQLLFGIQCEWLCQSGGIAPEVDLPRAVQNERWLGLNRHFQDIPALEQNPVITSLGSLRNQLARIIVVKTDGIGRHLGLIPGH